MIDLYRQELDIPEKPRTIGWLFLAIGGMMMLIAVWIFFQEAKEGATYRAPAWNNVSPTAGPNTPAPSQEKIELARAKARKYIWTVLFAFAVLLGFILILAVNHRFARYLRSQDDKPNPKTTITDPWKESARRIKVDPDEDR